MFANNVIRGKVTDVSHLVVMGNQPYMKEIPEAAGSKLKWKKKKDNVSFLVPDS